MTIDCHEVRRRLLAEPRSRGPELERHLASCAECGAYAAKLTAFEDRLVRALAVDPGPERAKAAVAVFPGRHRGTSRRWYAMAASVAFAAVIASALWLAEPGSSLAADVAYHANHEPKSWAAGAPAVSAAELDAVMAAAHLRMRPTGGRVSYASYCPFRGHKVPHLVVQVDNQPVTVMVLPAESIPTATRFEEAGYRGVLLKAPRGSVAVLIKRGEHVDIAAAAAAAAAAIEYL